MKTETFTQKLIKLALSIPAGRVTTYGLITAAAGGHPMLSRMVTHFLSKSKDVDKIPFHRIVYSNGKIWKHPGFDKRRLKLYQKEGILVSSDNKIKNFEEIIYSF